MKYFFVLLSLLLASDFILAQPLIKNDTPAASCGNTYAIANKSMINNVFTKKI